MLRRSTMSMAVSRNIVRSIVSCAMPVAVFLVLPSSMAWAQTSPLEDAIEDFEYWQNLCQLHISAAEDKTAADEKEADYGKALMACEQAIALEPEDAGIWVQHSRILLNTKQYPDAIASANRALLFDAEHSLAMTYQCMAYSALTQTEAALDRCNEALRVNGNWGDNNPTLAWLYRGIILAQENQYDQALVAYERTLLLEPDYAFALARKCEAHVALQQASLAIQTCNAALAGNDQWGEASPAMVWMALGRTHTQLGLYDDAIFAYDQALSLDPMSAVTWAAQGQVFEYLRHNEEALISYNRAVAIKADFADALLGQCKTLNRLAVDAKPDKTGEIYGKSLAACDAALAGDGDWGENTPANAWHERSIALTGTGKYEEALASINRAVGIEPRYAEAYNQRSIVYWYLRDYNRALEANAHALALDESYGHGWFTRGLIFRAQRQYPQALEAYNRGLGLNPWNEWAWTNRSLVLWELEEYEDALISAEEAITINPSSVQAWYNRGAAQSALGAYGSAVESYDRVLELDEKYGAALTGRGVARFHLGEDEDAMMDLQMALALNPEDELAKETLEALSSDGQGEGDR
ncbi:tetratricopeptide repeat protein [Leptothoe spongobia]|uniref:Tetratricopeptide repeat protein n=1 Tax=Leptothoe spongobia TAU-MAC 1115 TaxID=1967444 RepID=A0A947DCK5_9CYAN|nr:tetratricopeptide repeat protein [Leptothoe spongobia]MBT9314535.1 tetratricopeptide repeat protein [Leptothoe spongobia TAU-MAC 1115]